MELDVPDERREDLRETTERFRQAAQLAADRAFERNGDGYVITSKQTFHEHTYQQIRDATDGLNADLVCAARNYAADSAKGVVQAWKNGKNATQPTFTANTVVYTKKALTYTRPRGAEVSTWTVQLSTVPQSGDAERERRVYVRRSIGLSGSPPINPAVHGGGN